MLDRDNSISQQKEIVPSLSVVVAFKGAERCILDCLQSIYELDYPKGRIEVVLVDDFHDEQISGQIMERYPSVNLLRNKHPLGCDGSKQLGIDAANGDIIALTDADCTLSPMWAWTIAKNIADDANVVTGPVRHPQTLLRELVGASDFQDFQSCGRQCINNFPGCNFAAHRSIFQKIKYNKTGNLRGGSDRLFAWDVHKTGSKINYDPDMVVFHKPSVNLASLIRRRFMYGRVAITVRRLEPTLPGSVIAKLGPLSGLAYICYKIPKDTLNLYSMSTSNLVNYWHIPILLPGLVLFRLVDALAMSTYTKSRLNPQFMNDGCSDQKL